MFIAHSLFLAISCEEIRSIPRDYIQNSKILIYFVCNIQVHKCVRRVVKAFVIGIPSEMDISHFSFNNFNNECGIETRHNIHEKPSKSKTIKITCSHPPPPPAHPDHQIAVNQQWRQMRSGIFLPPVYFISTDESSRTS